MLVAYLDKAGQDVKATQLSHLKNFSISTRIAVRGLESSSTGERMVGYSPETLGSSPTIRASSDQFPYTYVTPAVIMFLALPQQVLLLSPARHFRILLSSIYLGLMVRPPAIGSSNHKGKFRPGYRAAAYADPHC